MACVNNNDKLIIIIQDTTGVAWIITLVYIYGYANNLSYEITHISPEVCQGVTTKIWILILTLTLHQVYFNNICFISCYHVSKRKKRVKDNQTNCKHQNNYNLDKKFIIKRVKNKIKEKEKIMTHNIRLIILDNSLVSILLPMRHHPKKVHNTNKHKENYKGEKNISRWDCTCFSLRSSCSSC